MFLFSCRSLGEGHLLHPGSGPRHPLAQVCEAMWFHIGAPVIEQAASDVMYSLRGQPFQSFFHTYPKWFFLRPFSFPLVERGDSGLKAAKGLPATQPVAGSPAFFIAFRCPLDGERFKSRRGFFENQGNPAGSTIAIIGLFQTVEVGEPLDRLVSQLFRNRHHQRVY